ncbi:aminoglycoside phosphotransferase family protein [Vallitalea okinawensis]|uniref:aminoglycoside phosphotransferase family protein n=1 Tax=Vallitalea okinawensis TaxID=2078660 RepID=UPI000CFA8D50|nr:aminoglycoside phosphotransferase family protein [Vallitalea okinawensis]
MKTWNENRIIGSGIISAVEKYLGGQVVDIKDKGQWVRHHYEVTLDTRSKIIFKLITNEEWSVIAHESNVINMLKQYDLPAPEIIAIDDTCELIPYPYTIQRYFGGIRLGQVLETATEEEKILLFKALGDFYRRLHAIKGRKSGLWDENDPYQTRYPVSPNDYMLQAEIINGSGKMALEEGVITRKQYVEVIKLWQENLDYLKDHEPVMIHVSPFYWNIYFDKTTSWKIRKIMSLGDVMWWDKAYDIATLKYPPFGKYDPDLWREFIKTYGEEPDEKRLLLYALMHRLCSAMGVYMEPKGYDREALKKSLSNDIEEIINRIGALD